MTTEIKCPECGEPVWDGPFASKLAKCWNSDGHEDGRTLAFDTMAEEDESAWPMTENYARDMLTYPYRPR